MLVGLTALAELLVAVEVVLAMLVAKGWMGFPELEADVPWMFVALLAVVVESVVLAVTC